MTHSSPWFFAMARIEIDGPYRSSKNLHGFFFHGKHPWNGFQPENLPEKGWTCCPKSGCTCIESSPTPSSRRHGQVGI